MVNQDSHAVVELWIVQRHHCGGGHQAETKGKVAALQSEIHMETWRLQRFISGIKQILAAAACRGSDFEMLQHRQSHTLQASFRSIADRQVR